MHLETNKCHVLVWYIYIYFVDCSGILAYLNLFTTRCGFMFEPQCGVIPGTVYDPRSGRDYSASNVPQPKLLRSWCWMVGSQISYDNFCGFTQALFYIKMTHIFSMLPTLMFETDCGASLGKKRHERGGWWRAKITFVLTSNLAKDAVLKHPVAATWQTCGSWTVDQLEWMPCVFSCLSLFFSPCSWTKASFFPDDRNRSYHISPFPNSIFISSTSSQILGRYSKVVYFTIAQFRHLPPRWRNDWVDHWKTINHCPRELMQIRNAWLM